MRRWPYTLPGHMAPGFVPKPFGQSDRTDMEKGAPRVRRRTFARRYETALTWVMTDAEFAAFSAWYEGRAVSLAGASDDIANWSLNETSRSTGAVVGPDLILVDVLRESTSTSGHSAQLPLPGAAFDNIAIAAHASLAPAGRDRARVSIVSRASVSSFADIDLLTGAVLNQSGLSSLTVTPRPFGFWAVALVAGSGVGVANPVMRVQPMAPGASYTGDGLSGIAVAELSARISTGFDLFVPCDVSGKALGGEGESAWFLYDMPLGGGLTRCECRFIGPYAPEGKPGFKWYVGANLEARRA
ncbi:MAG: hypothetical protein V4712_02770 [Pseudomonadota bacterium]